MLVLLPTHTSKLLASWKGPFTITDKISPVDYKVKVRGGKEKVYHVNMLKLWYERVDNNKCVNADIAACLNVISGLNTEVEDGEDVHAAITPVLKGKDSIDNVNISPDLTQEEKGTATAVTTGVQRHI